MERTTPSGISYEDLGSGDRALLCLPGWCIHRTMFHAVGELLAVRHRILALDWRGHGGSRKSTEDFGEPELLDDALSVIVDSGAKRFTPVAQAHAGWIALALRREFGERVDKLVLLSWTVGEPAPPFAAALSGLQKPAKWKATREQLLKLWLADGPPSVSAAVREEMEQHGYPMWSRAGREIGAAFAREKSPLRSLDSLHAPPPTLHLYAQPRTPEYLAMQQTFSLEHPWFTVQRLEGATHFPTLELPEVTAAAVDAFIG